MDRGNNNAVSYSDPSGYDIYFLVLPMFAQGGNDILGHEEAIVDPANTGWGKLLSFGPKGTHNASGSVLGTVPGALTVKTGSVPAMVSAAEKAGYAVFRLTSGPGGRISNAQLAKFTQYLHDHKDSSDNTFAAHGASNCSSILHDAAVAAGFPPDVIKALTSWPEGTLFRASQDPPPKKAGKKKKSSGKPERASN